MRLSLVISIINECIVMIWERCCFLQHKHQSGVVAQANKSIQLYMHACFAPEKFECLGIILLIQWMLYLQPPFEFVFHTLLYMVGSIHTFVSKSQHAPSNFMSTRKLLEHQESQFDHLGMHYIISGNPPRELKFVNRNIMQRKTNHIMIAS